MLIFCIKGMRPLLGPASCKFPVHCTLFAIQQLKTTSLPRAVIAIAKRLIACNPFNTHIT